MFKMDCIPVDPTYDLTLSITDKEANVMTLGSRQDKKNVEVEEKVIDLKPENENIEKNENINKNGTTKKARKAE